MPALTDEDRLFARYRESGDPGLLAAVFDRVAPELWRVARHLVRDDEAAEDLVQETFLVAIDRRAEYDPERRIVPWLLGITANLARRRRNERRATSLRESTTFTERDDPAEQAEHRETAALLSLALEQLAEPYRSVLTQLLTQGKPAHAIADERNCPASTVRNQVMRGMDLLRRALPAGVAGGLVVTTAPATSLARARQVVLEHATGPTPAVAITTGILLMKKTVLAVAVIATLGITLWTARSTGDPALPSVSVTPAAGSPSTPAATVHERTALGGVEREAVAPAENQQRHLDQLARLAVAVRYAGDDAPGADIGVYVRKSGRDELGSDRRTDADGRVAFENLAPGQYLVRTDRQPATSIALRAGANEVLEIVIPAGVLVHGEVIDVAGSSVGNARIYATRQDHHDFRQLTAIADAAGRFDIRDMAPGTALVGWVDGYQPSHPWRKTVSGAPGSETTIQLRLGARAHPLRGRVLDVDGSPAAHALVAVALDEDARQHPLGELAQKYASEMTRPLDLESFLVRCDASGAFETTCVPMGNTTVIARPRDPDAPLIAATRLLVRPLTDNEVELQLTPGATLRGQIVDDDGRGLAGVAVIAAWQGTMELGNLEHHVGRMVSDRSTITDRDGRFVLAGLLPGSYELHVGTHIDDRLRIAEHEELHSEMVEIGAGETLDWSTTMARRTTLEVIVRGPDQAPLAGWFVSVGDHPSSESPNALQRNRTDAGGHCVIDGVLAGSLMLWVHAPDANADPDPIPAAAFEAILPAGSPVTLRIDALPALMVSGRLAAPQPDKARVLLWMDGQTRARRTVPDPAGAFGFDGLAAGEYRLRIGYPDRPGTDLGPFTVRDGPLDLGTVEVPAR